MQTKKECLFLMQTRNKNWIIYEIITECMYKNRIIYKKISLSDRDNFLIIVKSSFSQFFKQLD